MDGSLDGADRERIRQIVAFVSTQETASLLSLIAPSLGSADAALVARMCGFIHAGLLIFPDNVAAAVAELPGLGIMPGPLLPSVVVRGRLAERHAFADPPDVSITHAAIPGCPGRDIELFLVSGNDPAIAGVARDEREFNREAHFALQGRDSPEETSRIWEILVGQGDLLPDGGGHNPHENPASGGRTVLYFRQQLPAGQWPSLLELSMDGCQAGLLTHHERAAMRWL
jgi:hypothetical protein